MLIKAGVDISRLNREIRRSLPRVEAIYDEYLEDFVITSTFEGNHGAGSLHYSNDAYDVRSPNENGVEIYMAIKENLGDSYDVASEGDHIHIEYDPKT
uniref:Peptidase n=1 Tax=viral metagenome TaxID=1070528 RepID=A0A6H1ZQA2_9ZZZZ